MNSKLLDFTIPLCILGLLTIIIAYTNFDLYLSSQFFIGGQWPVGERIPWKTLYQINRYPALFVAVAGLVMVCRGVIQKHCRNLIRPGLFLVLALALGPGLIVNVILKDHWGRPRPRQIEQFGGEKRFQQPWQKGKAGEWRSFPSGHAAGAFFIMAPFFIYRRKKPAVARIWILSGLLFGILMGIARITQGGHFISDVLWAWGVVHLVCVALYYLIGLDNDEPIPSTA